MKLAIKLCIMIGLLLPVSHAQAEYTAEQLAMLDQVIESFRKNRRLTGFVEFLGGYKDEAHICTASKVTRFDERMVGFFSVKNFHRKAMLMQCPKTLAVLVWRSDTNVASFYHYMRDFRSIPNGTYKGEYCDSVDGCNPYEWNPLELLPSGLIAAYPLTGTDVAKDYQTWRRLTDGREKIHAENQAEMQRAAEYEACKRRKAARLEISGSLGFGC